MREVMANAVVTGASTGIGRATALALARGVFKAWAAMRNPGAAAPLAGADASLAITPVAMDVDGDASVDDAFAQVSAPRGG
jgi:NAD(P)-dependent dehydrogenase (short-subunit alcohol dehydrogenase family)